jgi:putative transposase
MTNLFKFFIMPTPEELKAPFFSNCFYHIVCKSIDGLPLFNESKDYAVFLERFKKFNGGFMDVWAYCLLLNHAHYIIKIKYPAFIKSFISQLAPPEKTKAMVSFLADPTDESLTDAVIERQMNSFLVSYANYVNNKYNRKGGLFQKPFKRIQISSDSHLQQAVVYVHANAQKHGIVNDFKAYGYFSYSLMMDDGYNYTDSKSVIEFFGGIDKYMQVHNEQVAYFYSKGWPSSKLE